MVVSVTIVTHGGTSLANAQTNRMLVLPPSVAVASVAAAASAAVGTSVAAAVSDIMMEQDSTRMKVDQGHCGFLVSCSFTPADV